MYCMKIIWLLGDTVTFWEMKISKVQVFVLHNCKWMIFHFFIKPVCHSRRKGFKIFKRYNNYWQWYKNYIGVLLMFIYNWVVYSGMFCWNWKIGDIDSRHYWARQWLVQAEIYCVSQSFGKAAQTFVCLIILIDWETIIDFSVSFLNSLTF